MDEPRHLEAGAETAEYGNRAREGVMLFAKIYIVGLLVVSLGLIFVLAVGRAFL